MYDYWEECISEAFDDAGITASEDQINTVASWVEGAHENYGMAHGHGCIPNPLENENRELKRRLDEECDKVTCRECNGKGWIEENFGFRSIEYQCSKCRGEGRHLP